MYRITVKNHFSAAHHLRNYNGDCENVHGHNWEVEVTAKYTELSEDGIGMDFRDLSSVMEEVTGNLDHMDLNTMEYFREKNPTSENIAEYIYRGVKEKGVPVESVKVSETPRYFATFSEE